LGASSRFGVGSVPGAGSVRHGSGTPLRPAQLPFSTWLLLPTSRALPLGAAGRHPHHDSETPRHDQAETPVGHDSRSLHVALEADGDGAHPAAVPVSAPGPQPLRATVAAIENAGFTLVTFADSPLPPGGTGPTGGTGDTTPTGHRGGKPAPGPPSYRR